METVQDITDKRVGEYIYTYAGIKFWPLDPRPEEICIGDIAHALSLLCRYNGHVPFHYSVAHHSLYVSDVMEKQYGTLGGLCGLMHDAAEAYIGDMTRPLKRTPSLKVFSDIEDNLLKVIFAKFQIPMMDYKHADNSVLMMEKQQLGKQDQVWHVNDYHDLQEDGVIIAITPMHPREAEHLFLETFNRLMMGVS